jgi:uncharacterized membrane protein YfcA
LDFVHGWIVPPEAEAAPGVYVLVALAALFFTAVSKGGFGGGVGAVSVPLMLQVLPARFVIGLWLPVLIASDIATIRRYPRTWSRDAFIKLTPGMLAGITLATLLLKGLSGADAEREALQEAWLKFGIAVISVVFVAWRSLPTRERAGPGWRPTWGVSLPAGLAGGVTTTLAHAAGPIVSMFLLAQKLDKRVFVGTTGRFYFTFNTIKIPFLIAAGAMSFATARYGLWLIVLSPLGVWFGAWLNRKVSAAWFVRLVHIFLLFAAGKLAWDWARLVL